ncbi:MAG: nucleoside hydrolase [Candidatus Nanopelagicales bacterium]
MLRRIALIALAALVMLSSSVAALGTVGAAPAQESSGADCVLIDTDFDIDDMMAIPLVIGNRPVAAIITSEGYTKPRSGAAALSRLIAEPGQRTIPIIVGAASHLTRSRIIDHWGRFVLDYRALMNRLNDFLPVPLRLSRPQGPRYERQVAQAVAGCRSVDIKVIGTFTSFVHYSPRIRSKINQVVIMGKPLRGDTSQRPGNLLQLRVRHARLQAGVRPAAARPRSTPTWMSPARIVTTLPTPRAAPAGLRADPVDGGPVAQSGTAVHAQAGTPEPPRQLGHRSLGGVGLGGKSLLWDQSASLYLLKPDSSTKSVAAVATTRRPDHQLRSDINGPD